MLEFPKWKYHLVKEAVIVESKEEEESLGAGWADNPSAFMDPNTAVTVDPAPSKKQSKGSKS